MSLFRDIVIVIKQQVRYGKYFSRDLMELVDSIKDDQIAG
jgi:hypothetical protein